MLGSFELAWETRQFAVLIPPISGNSFLTPVPRLLINVYILFFNNCKMDFNKLLVISTSVAPASIIGQPPALDNLALTLFCIAVKDTSAYPNAFCMSGAIATAYVWGGKNVIFGSGAGTDTSYNPSIS